MITMNRNGIILEGNVQMCKELLKNKIRKGVIMNNKGFTLTELMLVIVIMGIITAIVAPRMGARDKLDQGEELFRQKLLEARTQAQLNNQFYRTVWSTSQIWIQYRDAALAWHDTLGKTSIPPELTPSFPDTVRFNTNGAADDGNGFNPPNITITDMGTSRTLTLVISPIGTIKKL